MHPSYSSRTKQNDIALLKLEKPAELKHNIWPACLSISEKGPVTNLSVIGFGKFDTEQDKTSKWLLKARVDEISLESCQEHFMKIAAAPPVPTQICAHNTKIFSDTCQGESFI
jgi:secreted trypsin-like serine protease